MTTTILKSFDWKLILISVKRCLWHIWLSYCKVFKHVWTNYARYIWTFYNPLCKTSPPVLHISNSQKVNSDISCCCDDTLRLIAIFMQHLVYFWVWPQVLLVCVSYGLAPWLRPVSQRMYMLIIQILGKIWLAPRWKIIRRGHNLAHAMTAELSWHVQNCNLIGSLEPE